MINVIDKSLCCGCGLCESVCPKKAITMKEDEKGFLYPYIDEIKCINCNICSNYCAFQKEHKEISNIKEIYALQHNDINVLNNSSSGGAFTAFSDIILNEKGSIYGAAYDENFNVLHLCANNIEERNKFRSSKYVQSSTKGVFEKIVKDLDSGKKVLFTGTPCQCASLLSYFKEKPKNLFLMDILCHGVPSNKVLKDYILYLEKEFRKKIIDFNYRSKKYGYNQMCEITFENNKKNYSPKLFQIHKFFVMSMRDSCHNCPYASQYRYSDITVGDYWDFQESNGIKKENGVSIVFINSENGKELFNNLCNTKILKIDNYKGLNKRQALNFPTKKHIKTDEFWEYYFNHEFKDTINKYGKWTLKSSLYQYQIRLKFILKSIRKK